MPIEFQCPLCRNLLQVADGTEGRQARCPVCGTVATIPVLPNRSTDETDIQPVEEKNGNRSAVDGITPYAYGRVSSPSTWLIVVGAMGIGLGLIALLLVVINIAQQAPRMPRHEFDVVVQPGTGNLVGVGIELISSLLILLGGIKMKQLENYRLATIAALLAIVPCTSPCCLLSMPFGIWALVVLSDPYVKSAFR